MTGLQERGQAMVRIHRSKLKMVERVGLDFKDDKQVCGQCKPEVLQDWEVALRLNLLRFQGSRMAW